MSCSGAPRGEYRGNAEPFELGDVVRGDGAAERDDHVIDSLLSQQGHDPRNEGHVGTGQDRQAVASAFSG